MLSKLQRNSQKDKSYNQREDFAMEVMLLELLKQEER
jgi:hypothetical protein